MISDPKQTPIKTAILLLNMGGPESADEVHPYLKELFQDRELLKLPVQKILGIKGQPSFEHHKIWPQSIPIPDRSTDKRIEAANLLNQANEGLYISGAHISGAPLQNCMTF